LFCFVCTSVGLLPPGESLIWVSSSSSSSSMRVWRLLANRSIPCGRKILWMRPIHLFERTDQSLKTAVVLWFVAFLYLTPVDNFSWGIRSSGMLGSVYWWLPTFRDTLSVPLSLEDGTDRLCRKVGNCRSVLRATKCKRRRHWHPWRRPEVTYLFFPSPHPSHDIQYYTTPLPLAKVLRYLYFDSAVTEIVVALMTFYYVTPKTFSVNRQGKQPRCVTFRYTFMDPNEFCGVILWLLWVTNYFQYLSLRSRGCGAVWPLLLRFRELRTSFDTQLIICIVAGETLITRLTTQRWLDVGEDWTEDEHRSSHSVMKYEYRVTCDAHYYGAGCANLCRPRDDNFGHYKCSPTGERVCLSGWQGDYCTKRKYFACVCHLSLGRRGFVGVESLWWLQVCAKTARVPCSFFRNVDFPISTEQCQ
jgi:hypothetical protein